MRLAIRSAACSLCLKLFSACYTSVGWSPLLWPQAVFICRQSAALNYSAIGALHLLLLLFPSPLLASLVSGTLELCWQLKVATVSSVAYLSYMASSGSDYGWDSLSLSFLLSLPISYSPSASLSGSTASSASSPTAVAAASDLKTEFFISTLYPLHWLAAGAGSGRRR